jgi:hypothetical protein
MSDVTIPEDVQAKAEEIAQELVDHAFKHGKLVNAYLPDFIARAILAERERCAKVCEAVGSDVDPQLADHIAQAIRSSHE